MYPWSEAVLYIYCPALELFIITIALGIFDIIGPSHTQHTGGRER